MGGTKEGGLKAATTNRRLHGKDFYSRIGAKGGRKSHGGGFAAMPRETVARLGAKGGKASRRGVAISCKVKAEIYGDYNSGLFSIKEIAARHHVSKGTVSRIVRELSPF